MTLPDLQEIIEYVQFVQLKYAKLSGEEKKKIVLKHLLTLVDDKSDDVVVWLSKSIDLICMIGLKKIKSCCC